MLPRHRITKTPMAIRRGFDMPDRCFSRAVSARSKSDIDGSGSGCLNAAKGIVKDGETFLAAWEEKMALPPVDNTNADYAGPLS